MPIELGSLSTVWKSLKEKLQGIDGPLARKTAGSAAAGDSSFRKSRFSARFPLILDDMILRDFALYLVLILTTAILIVLVFTYFELLTDIMRNRIPPLIQAEYLWNVSPSLLYLIAPLAVLLSVLITFGLMEKGSELTAMKASGVSVYRAALPVVVISAIFAVGLFLFDQLYIPQSNRQQEILRNQIKGKPAQTYLQADRKWIFGEHNTIYYYQFFDPYQNSFANITAFQFDPATFELTARVHASRAHWSAQLNKWVFEQGWARTFQGSAIQSYHPFDADTFPLFIEPPSYFKKDVRQSSEMNSRELRAYIADLRQSGFDVVRLNVQLQKKFAYPLITLVMAVLAVPFSLSAGRKGALTGIAVALALAITYFVAAGLFEAMGNASQLPATMAAWAPDLIFALLGGYLLLKVPT
jgi:LPS export ABC transporter permease LptG